MSGTTLTGAYLHGVRLSSNTANPVTVASTADVYDANYPAVLGASTVAWSLVNDGTIISIGTTNISVGVWLEGSGSIVNAANARISGAQYGVFILGTVANSLSNAGAISATGTAGRGAKLPGGTVDNLHGGTISGQYGLWLSQAGTLDNAGAINTPGSLVSNTYAVVLSAAGTVTNFSNGTISSNNVGIVDLAAGTVLNSGSIASTHGFVGGSGDFAAVDLRAGGLVTNLSGGHITSEWKAVAFGVAQTPTAASSTLTATLDNQGYVYADDPTTGSGAAAWVHTNGVILNSGTIAGGPFAIVAYYDITVQNSGTISGSEFAVFQSSTLASDLVQVAPGATFSGVVLGGAGMVQTQGTNAAANAATGTLELLSGAGAGTISGFADRYWNERAPQGAPAYTYGNTAGTYFNFSNVTVDAGATWTLGGTVSAGQTIAFAGDGALTLDNPTQMRGTIDGFNPGVTLGLAGLVGATAATINVSDQIVVTGGAGPLATLQLDPGRHDPAGTQVPLQTSDGVVELVACFAEGTRIATDLGEVAVQALQPGMRVRSPFGGSRPIIWVGHRRTECHRHPRPQDVMPVRVQAGAFAPGLPARALWLSPDHAVFVGGALIPVRYLLNGRSIAQIAVESIRYWHVELDRHDVLLADGLPCESYLDTGNRAAFEAGGPAVALHPDFALRVWEAHACAPLLRHGPALAAVRADLLRRATELGHVLTESPALSLWAGGCRRPSLAQGALWHTRVPAGAVRLRSRCWVPAETRADAQDTRRLGVAVADLTLDGRPLALDDAGLTDGWHPAEAGWRWTDGDAGLLVPHAGLLTLRLALGGSYWTDAITGLAAQTA